MRKLKLILACMLMTFFGIGQVWATEESVDVTPANALNDGGVDPITIACAKGDGTSNPAISSGQLRLYQAGSGKTTGNTITFSSTYAITKIEFTFANSMTADNGSFSDGTYDSGTTTWTGSTNSLTLTVTGTSSSTRIYITAMKVYYETGGGTPTCATPTFTPAAGSYEGIQNVTISSTAEATIYYTTDESDPKSSATRQVYSAAIPVAADMTIKAYAVKDSYNDSEVATAAYTITEGPDATIAFVGNTDWDIPSGSGNKTVDEGTYTDGTYTIKIAGSTGEGYYINGYLFLGKTGAYVELPEFSNPIEKIVVVGTSGGSTGVKFNIYDGTTAVSTEVTGCKNVSQEFAIENPAANKAYKVQVTSSANLQISAIKIYYGTAPAVAKPTISGDENFVTSTSVTISHADADAIYYTIDGSDPKTSGTKLTYSAPFAVNADGTTTVKAYAVKGSDASDVASKEFTKVTALATMAEVQAAAEADEKAINVVISNWVVTAANSSQAWIADANNAKGILLYKNSHGFTAGKKLNGTVIGTKVKLYNLYPELTSLLASEVTVTDAEAITPRTTTIAALTSGHPAEQGTVVKLEGVTYSSSVLSDGVNSISADNKFFSSLALVDGTTYDITGVVTYYKDGDNPVVKIAPRSAADVEAQTPVVTPTAANLAALKAAARGTYILTLTNAVVTYVNGNNAFIEDATGGALIYFASHGYSAGDCLNGDYQVVTTDFQGKFEITAIEPQAGAATTTAAIPLTTVSIATLNANFSSYESRRVKIVGANVTDAISGSDRNGAINDGAALAVYAAAGTSTITLTADDNVDIIGYPGFHNTDQQLTVWARADITVNEKDPAGIAFTPESETITGGDSWSAPTFANPNNLDVTFGSDAEGVATVSNTGVVALAGGYGTAVITAHTNGDATHSAGNATYTITVNDPSVAPVYTMSFDLTRASYDDAADAEVVWNSNVVTITAQQSTGTKVTNYLAGNYTGTTLIAETRLYENNNLIFTPKSGITITKVEWKATTKAYAESLAKEGTTTAWTNATAVIDGTDDKKVIITPSAAGEFSAVLGKSGSNKGTRGASVVVYYEAESEKSKLAASIAIANINTAVGEDDILLSDIAATSNPNKKAISYAVTSGSEYVSITGEGPAAAFHALAEGTATITATIPNDLGNYTGATTTFDIVVAAAPATLTSIAISGTASALEYTDGQHFNPAGLVVTGTYSDASAAPITEGIDWTFDPDPLTEGTTSVSVTATVGSISSEAFAVNGLTVGAAAAPTSGNVVILAEYNSKFYAMSNSLTSGALAGVEVEKDGSNIVVASQTIKEAIQWTATVDGDNTTFQDGEGKYLVHNGTGTNLDLTDAAENWTFNSENGCYSSVSGRAFFYYSTNGVFKNYSISNNLGKTGYSGAPEVIEIDPANIVISSKANPELAYSPASDEITVGDAWSAPELTYASGFDGLAAVTYASNNEAVATVSDAGVIALAGGTGTAVITASFAGNANYLLGSATYTIKVNEVPDNCDATDDFSTANSSSPTSYTTRTTTAGWGATNAGYKVINDASYLMINGKTTAVGVITSPVLSDGIASLKFRYANTNNESNGVSVRIDIKQGTEVVKTYTLTKANSEVTKDVVYTEIIENINVAGEFQIIFTNLSPSNNTGNADRVSIGRLCWSNYSATPTPVETWTEGVRTGLTAGWYYTMCLNKAVTNVRGASIWRVLSMAANGKDVILEDVAGTLDAGRPYIFYATAASLDVVYTGDAVGAPITTGNNGLIGSFSQELIEQSATNYIIYNNELYFVNSTAYVGANRAYLDMTAVPGYTSSSPAPGRQRVVMKAHGAQVATGMDEINASETPVKMMINGELFILRGEKMYDATGRLVK